MKANICDFTGNVGLTGKAHGVLALYHNILGARPDGYHKFQSFLQKLAIFDNVTVNVTKGSGKVTIKAAEAYPENYVKEVVSRFLTSFSIQADATISIDSRMPVNFGLFEAEAAAATAIKLVNKCLGEPVSRIALLDFANSVSNELLCCTVSGTKYADMLDAHKCMISSMPPIPSCGILIAHKNRTALPGYSESVKLCDEFYGSYWDRRGSSQALRCLLDAVPAGDFNTVISNNSNVFLPPLSKKFADVEATSALLRKLGADATGTVSHSTAVYGIFKDRKMSAAAAESSMLYDHTVILTEPV
ncbi:MAG: hypothetical protein IJN63_05715 [Clostridia bacterium]|nr:hypothetical protein [Clostridia bacterium]